MRNKIDRRESAWSEQLVPPFARRHPRLAVAFAVVFFLGWTLPLGISQAWPAFVKNKTIPEWLAEKDWPVMNVGFYNWFMTAVYLIVVFALFAFVILVWQSTRKGHFQDNDSERQAEGLAPKASSEIVVVSPLDNEQVGLLHAVRGYVTPPDAPIQVLVYSRNRKWYLQRSVQVVGHIWNVECTFGNESTPDGSVYRVVAVMGNQLKEEKYDKLPDAMATSNSVTVHRRANN